MCSGNSVGNPPDLSQGPWPPGCAGGIASFIYQNAQRPVPEVAIVGALGLLAGLCGKQWNIPGSGLNCYIVLVARSAIGKEAMSKGLGILQAEILRSSYEAAQFVHFTDFASGPALIKHALTNLCFVQVAGEFGDTLLHMANDTPSGPMSTLRRVMLSMYAKSGAEDVVGGIAYSNQDNNIESVKGVSYSMIGETTPGKFYKAINSDLLANGFMSRLTIVEYEGERPPRNTNIVQQPWKELVDWLRAIVVHAGTLEKQGKTQAVAYEDGARKLFDDFEDQCDTSIKEAGDNESARQMWNRASLKAQRIAALLAVGDNYLNPIMTALHAEWAIDLILRDIEAFRERMKKGDVGTDDHSYQLKVRHLIYKVLTANSPIQHDRQPQHMTQAGVVTHAYLAQQTSRAFGDHPKGATIALREAVAALIDGGWISECDRYSDSIRAQGYKGKAYRIARELRLWLDPT